MLSIAMIAAALLSAGFILRLRGQEYAQRATVIRAVWSSSMMTSTPPPPSVSAPRASEAVALVLRVQNPDCACEKARKFVDKTFLIGDAPKLPFKDCTRADCSCRYERITERRKSKGDRRVKANRREEIRFEMKGDRRSGKDRRQTNNVWKRPV